VRDQQGEAAFGLIERIRQNSVRFRRDDDIAARRELEDILDALSREQTIQVVRAFSYFSHLANIAEDQHHIRRSRAHLIAGSTPREGSLAHALQRALDSGRQTPRRWPVSSTARWCRRCSPPTPPRCSARASSTARP
jgi:phosphoenolpyruvate carboxylase